MKKTLLTISAGLLLSLGAFAQTYPETVVADGENGNATKVGSFWFGYTTSTSTILVNGKAPGDSVEMSTGGYAGSCISVNGVLENTAAPNYSSAGVGFALAPLEATLDENSMVTNSADVAVDLSAAQGIKFMYKKTGDPVLILGVFTTDIKQNAGHDYFIELPAATDWTEFTVSFPGSDLEEAAITALAQPTWLGAGTTPWDGSKAFKLQFQVKDADGAYTFAVDNITIIGAELANKLNLSAAWYALEAWIDVPANNATQATKDALAAALLVLNSPSATQAQVDAATASIAIPGATSKLTADLAVKADEIVISATKTISSVSLINAAGSVVSKVSVGSSVATVSTAAAKGATVAVIVYADGSVESTTFVK